MVFSCVDLAVPDADYIGDGDLIYGSTDIMSKKFIDRLNLPCELLRIVLFNLVFVE